jgi:hypothetical protein
VSGIPIGELARQFGARMDAEFLVEVTQAKRHLL